MHRRAIVYTASNIYTIIDFPFKYQIQGLAASALVFGEHCEVILFPMYAPDVKFAAMSTLQWYLVSKIIPWEISQQRIWEAKGDNNSF